MSKDFQVLRTLVTPEKFSFDGKITAIELNSYPPNSDMITIRGSLTKGFVRNFTISLDLQPDWHYEEPEDAANTIVRSVEDMLWELADYDN